MVIVALIVVALSAAPARAASSRAEFVAQVEPICQAAQKPTFKAYGRLFKSIPTTADTQHPTKRVIRKADRALGRFYTQISGIYGRTSGRIASVPPAPGDESAVASWLAGRSQAVTLGLAAGRAARHLKVGQASRLADRAIAASDTAVRSVSDFGFHVCAFSFGHAESDTNPF
jgi:hypothetical protein